MESEEILASSVGENISNSSVNLPSASTNPFIQRARTFEKIKSEALNNLEKREDYKKRIYTEAESFFSNILSCEIKKKDSEIKKKDDKINRLLEKESKYKEKIFQLKKAQKNKNRVSTRIIKPFELIGERMRRKRIAEAVKSLGK